MNDKKMGKSNLKIVWIMFFIYLLLFVFFNITGKGTTSLPWLVLEIWSIIISTYLLIVHKFPPKKNIVTAIVLTIVYLLSTIALFNGIFTLINAVCVFISACASFSVFNKYKGEALHFVSDKGKHSVIISILIGVLFGVLFGIINYFMMKGSNSIEPSNPLLAFWGAINPAVYEEVALRTIFYAFCLHLVRGKFGKRGKKITYAFMMMIPHILPHTSFNNPVEWLITIVLYVVVFGFIFFILQKKRDVLSAIIAHGTVDFVRFCIFGLPL